MEIQARLKQTLASVKKWLSGLSFRTGVIVLLITLQSLLFAH